MDNATNTKAAPIYRYRVVVKDGKAIVERRAMKWTRASFYGAAQRLVPIRDWTSAEYPEAETEHGAIDAARAQQQRNVDYHVTRVMEAEAGRDKAVAANLQLATLAAK